MTIGVDHIQDINALRDKLKEMDRRIEENTGALSSFVQNMEVQVTSSSGIVIFDQVSQPPVPATGTALWKKSPVGGPTTWSISATNIAGTRIWQWFTETA